MEKRRYEKQCSRDELHLQILYFNFIVRAHKKVIRICDDATLLNEVGGILAQAGEKSLTQKALRRSITLLPEKGFEKYLTLAQFCTVKIT